MNSKRNSRGIRQKRNFTGPPLTPADRKGNQQERQLKIRAICGEVTSEQVRKIADIAENMELAWSILRSGVHQKFQALK